MAVISVSRPVPATFSLKKLLNCTHEAESTQFQRHYFSENLAEEGIEPGPLDLQPGTLTTKPQRRSNFTIMLIVTVTSRQGNNEEQAHTRNKGTNEHDWKEGQFRPKHVVVLKILKILKMTSVENTEKCFKTLTSRTKDGEEK
jgi:hypothetical protein